MQRQNTSHTFLLKWLLFAGLLCNSLMAFPPANYTTFLQNCLRLLQTGQYEVLQQYFIKYYQPTNTAPSKKKLAPPNSQQKINNKNLLSKIAKEIPIAEIKLKILQHAIVQNKTQTKKDVLHCYIGEQLSAQKQYAQAKNNFFYCNSDKRYFFLAFIFSQLNNNPQAIFNFTQVEKIYPKRSTKIFSKTHKDEIAIKKIAIAELAKLYAAEKKYSLSLKYAKKIPSGVKREIALYTAYMGLKKTSRAKRIARGIERKYSTTLAGKAFLSNF